MRMQYPAKLRSKPYAIWLILAVCFALCGTAVAAYDHMLTSRLAKSSVLQFADSFHKGYACGLLPASKVHDIFNKELIASGTVVSAYNPVASVRRGSPRVDSCSYTDPDSSNRYVDLVIKTYESPKIAADAYDFDSSKIIGIADRPAPAGTIKNKYASGVFYVLKEDKVIELGAGTEGSTAGPGNEQFVSAILAIIVRDV